MTCREECAALEDYADDLGLWGAEVLWCRGRWWLVCLGEEELHRSIMLGDSIDRASETLEQLVIDGKYR